MKSEFGIIGMGVMGRNLSRNFARNGIRVSLYNRRVEGKEENVAHDLIAQYQDLHDAQGFEDISAFIQSIEKPRKILLIVTAGQVVDHLAEELSHELESGDIIIDGGNSHFKDSNRRYEWARAKNLDWISMGISGGSEGALNGPSLMPSGRFDDVDKVLPILQKIAAKDTHGNACCTYIGKEGSGHFVKMVHNGIEYCEMQLITEIYDLLKNGNGLSNPEISHLFKTWNEGRNRSYLLEITATILTTTENNTFLLDQILDVAQGKGTGIWTSNTASELGAPASLISVAINERFISNFKDLRTEIADRISWDNMDPIGIEKLEEAYYCARVINHVQDFEIIRIADIDFDWGIDLSRLAAIWTNGCIIRSKLMSELSGYLKGQSCLLQSKEILELLQESKTSLGFVIQKTIAGAIPLPTLSSAFNYLKSMSRKNSAMNLIQAQRDFFGSHTYQKIGDPNYYTTDWTPVENQ